MRNTGPLSSLREHQERRSGTARKNIGNDDREHEPDKANRGKPQYILSLRAGRGGLAKRGRDARGTNSPSPSPNPLPARATACTHLSGGIPPPPCGEDPLGRRPSEKGVAGHRPLGRSRSPRHQSQGQAASHPSGLGPLRLTRLSASATRRSMPGDPPPRSAFGQLVLPHKGGGEARTHAVVCIP